MPFLVQKVKGTVDVSVPIMVIDSADGTPETGYAHDTTGVDFWYRREGGAEVSITEAALAAWNSAHADGGIEHGSNGRGRLDLPDAACAVGSDGASYCEYGGHFDDMVVIGGIIQLLDPINELFKSHVVGATGNDATHAHVPGWASYVDDALFGYVMALRDVSAGITTVHRITDWDQSDELATFTPALPNSATVQASTDLATLLGKVDDRFGFTTSGQVDANMQYINDVQITGDGDGTPFDVA